MSLDIKDLRNLSFVEFCDEWLDELDEKYDYAGEVWVELFREHIFRQIIELRQKAEKVSALVNFLESEEVYEIIVKEFVKERGLLDLPAFETLYPYIASYGDAKQLSFSEAIALLKSKLAHEARSERNHSVSAPQAEKQSGEGHLYQK